MTSKMKWSPKAASTLSLRLLEKFESRSTGNIFPPSLQLSFLESHTHFSIFTFRPGPISKCEAEEFLHSYICESQTELKGLASLPPFSSQTAYFHHSAQRNWRPLGFPYFERPQKEPLQLLMKGCREELKLSQQSSQFVLEQSLIQFIMQGLCWCPSIR